MTLCLIIKLLICLVIISSCSCFSLEYKDQLLLTVYYESNDVNSRKLIVQQLLPAMKVLHNHIILELIPFGKSKSIDYGRGGFNCRHGPAECLGNLIQVCTLNLMYRESDLDKALYVACEMKTSAALRKSMGCVQKTNISEEEIKSCMTTSYGTQLQLSSEYLTKNVQPKDIPTITINGVFDKEIQKDAITHLFGTLCSVLKDTKPCAKYFNEMVWNEIIYGRPLKSLREN